MTTMRSAPCLFLAAIIACSADAPQPAADVAAEDQAPDDAALASVLVSRQARLFQRLAEVDTDIGPLIAPEFTILDGDRPLPAPPAGATPFNPRGAARHLAPSYFQSLHAALDTTALSATSFEVRAVGSDEAYVIVFPAGGKPSITRWRLMPEDDWRAYRLFLNASTETIDRLRRS